MKYNIPDHLNDITYDIIGAAFEVRKQCGKGLLENYYEAALAYELELKGHKVNRQVLVPALYKGVPVKDPYKIDILVDNEIIVELKSVSHLISENFSQLATYLWLTDKKVGLLINFSAKDFRSGTWTKEKPDYNIGIVRIIQSKGNKFKGNL
ncbi:MAG: GxxExxY protein [Muribaculaceae bacterium]|nr:GxxExxY protein [Muribaculaceae bacterium]